MMSPVRILLPLMQAAFIAVLWASQGATATAQTPAADSLPAFKSDSAAQDPFRQVESGPSPFGVKPAAASGGRPDTGAVHIDSVTSQLRKRRPGISVYLGVDFIDFNAKEKFQNSLAARITGDSSLSPSPLQPYELVHLAFPVGMQASYPISTYLDLVAKTHSYWYKQTAILGNKTTNTHAADEWYAVQANLGGAGIRYCLPPALLSVSGQLGLYTQGIWYWNLGNSEIYTPYGHATSSFRPLGSGYELQFGFQKAMTKPWQVTGAIGFIHQQFSSTQEWKDVLAYAPPPGKVGWASSSIQATLNLWYNFGVIAAPTASAPTLTGPATAPSPNPVSAPAPAPPTSAPAPAPTDSSRHF